MLFEEWKESPTTLTPSEYVEKLVFDSKVEVGHIYSWITIHGLMLLNNKN